ncbi:hypothetical protein [Paenibacillus illinoisensis]|uniref:Calcineurin-like phosphoesterase domain-containing protein n=1 Tax=Paenibacillus illinoisensis TaxID=59845 RepID=A0A2W0C6H9_9BACL|nr:hypothetical protein [Paenibacillus illinoisensis]PYY28343.1 Uncharacterized protein PIL02S_03494 [Paenibacillus illinoisensis]
MTQNETLKKPAETIIDYLVRLGDNLERYSLNWSQAAELLNKESDEEYTESRWRKKYAAYVEWKTYILENYVSNEIADEVRDATIEMKKETVKLRDQKREYNQLIFKEARFDNLKNQIQEAIMDLHNLKPLSPPSTNTVPTTNRKAISLWSDWHIGSEFKNSFNTYNIDTFRARLSKLIDKTIAYSHKNGIDEILIANLGDIIHGAIHVSARVQSGEDVINQIQIAAESVAEALAEVSRHHRKVKFINIIGNHSRLISNKHDSIFRENLEYLIPWFLETRLRDFTNIEIVKDTDGIYVEEIDGEKHVFVHGDLDSAYTSAKNLPQILGFVPKYIYSGHIHHNYEKEFGKTEVIVNGSLMGVDDYAVSKRYFATPMQKYLVLQGTDIECTYKIKL